MASGGGPKRNVVSTQNGKFFSLREGRRFSHTLQHGGNEGVVLIDNIKLQASFPS